MWNPRYTVCNGGTPRRKGFLRRRGATVLEFALVAPVVLFFFFAAVMFDGMLMSQNMLTAAAREGGRLASLPSANSQEAVIAAVQESLRQGGADPDCATIDVDPTDLGSLSTGDEVTISVSLPLGKSTWFPLAGLVPDKSLSTEITFIRE